MRKLGVVDICGLDYVVSEGKPGEAGSVLNDSTAGVCDNDALVIHLDKDGAVPFKRQTLCHEVLHGLVEHSGAMGIIATALGKDRHSDVVGELEENLMRVLAPHLKNALPGLVAAIHKLK